MAQYIIVGDTDSNADCLVAICGADKERAEQVLARMLENPTDNDRYLTRGHHNLRVKRTNGGWWNDPFLLG